MDRKFREELKQMYQAPDPVGKDAFLQELEQKAQRSPEMSGISFLGFLGYQVPYISIWNWLLGASVFALTLLSVRYADGKAVWAAASFVPFLALAAVSESGRSMQYGMDELELSARYCLKTVVTVKIFIMGISNLIVLLACILAVEAGNRTGIILNGITIMFPYLVTAFLNLWIVRKIHGKESIYVCLGVSAIVSGANVINGVMEWFVLYDYLGTAGMLVLFLAAVLLTGRECIKFMRQSEEYVWN